MNLEKKIISRYYAGYYDNHSRQLRKNHPAFWFRLKEILCSCDDAEKKADMVISEGFPNGFWKEFDSDDEKLINPGISIQVSK